MPPKHQRQTSPSSSDEDEAKTRRITDLRNEDDDDYDDAEANEDLSLKILERAMHRQRDAHQNGGASDDGVVMVTDLRTNNDSELKKKKKKKKKREHEALNGSVSNKESSDLDTNFKSFCGALEDDSKEEQKAECQQVVEVGDKAANADPVEASDNLILRRLLRGPRYFDPPDSGWGTCYNCGEEGHAAVNCTATKRKKPCFICGSLEHNAKQCVKGQDCFICKKGGHRAKDCPEKSTKGSQIAKMCLKCGEAGHDMFLCRSSYSPDDLKEIQCYVCLNFGHLCCVEYTDSGPAEISCYRCGQLGHTGLACLGLRGETSGAGAHSSCYRCGEEGHFARECTSSMKVGKRSRELSTPKKRWPIEKDRDVRSAPNDPGKARKKKKSPHDGGFTSASKLKHKGGWRTNDPGDFQDHEWHASASRAKRRGGWITDDPGDFDGSGYRDNGWRSSGTPSNRKAKLSSYASSASSSRSHKPNYSNSGSYGSSKYYQHRFSASRFGNNSSDVRRDYDWY